MQVARPLAAAAVLLTVAGLTVACGGSDEPPVDADPRFGEQPNIVFVLTDDQDLASYTRRTMPNTHRLLEEPGTNFTNYVDPTPLCCPARAALFTGQYGHNNGVLSNKPGYGLLAEPENLLPTWLQRVGYQTAYVGKFLNGYEKTTDKHKDVPPGWDRWVGLIGSHGYYTYTVSVDGKKRNSDGEYLTDYLNRKAVALVRELSGEQPFYLQVSQLAPHVENINSETQGRCGGETVPADQDMGRFADVGLPDTPSLNERDVSDKPDFVAGDGPLSDKAMRRLAERYECRLESLAAVDRGIADIVRALGASGELKQTVIVFASDNGTFHGEHRLPGGKGLAYEEAAKLPMVMKVPEAFRGGGPVAPRVEEPTASIDFAPTVLDWAGAPSCPADGPCRVLDGRSWIPLLTGERDAWPPERPIATELDLNTDAIEGRRGISCVYQGVRAGRWVYIRHTEVPDPVLQACVEEKVVEQYDLERDPYELDNLAAVDFAGSRATAAARRLSRLTDELADCAGIEGRDPEPASGHYCR